MNLYNIVISSAVNSFVLILLEGIIFFTLVNTIFSNLFQSIINDILQKINKIINVSYYGITPLINSSLSFDISKKSPEFQSLAIKLYTVGTMNEQIIEEKQFINKNNIKSYIIYTIYILSFFILIGIIIYINKKIYKNEINISSTIYNVILSLILFIIFIVTVSFTIFINIADNIDFNNVEIKFIKIIQKLFV